MDARNRQLIIPKEHVDSTCRPGEGPATCKYLMFGSGGWHCAKLDPGWKAHIDERTDMNAKGDNCKGWGAPAGFRWASEDELEPLDSDDAKLLSMTQEAIMSNTVLPSGAKVPDGIWVVQGGLLKRKQ